MSQKALTAHAGIEQPTMAATLARMERDGVIERHSDPDDRRSVLFTLSERTRSQAAEIKAAIQKLNGDALDGIAQTDQEMFRDILTAIAAAIEQKLACEPAP